MCIYEKSGFEPLKTHIHTHKKVTNIKKKKGYTHTHTLPPHKLKKGNIYYTCMKKRRASAATIARLKAMRRKFGLGEFQHRKNIVPKRRRVVSMAKRKVSRRKGASSGGTMSYALGGAVYGIARQPLNGLIKKFLPSGTLQMSDEILMIVADVILSKYAFKTGTINKALKVGIAVEASRIGANLNIGNLGGLFGTSTAAASSGLTF